MIRQTSHEWLLLCCARGTLTSDGSWSSGHQDYSTLPASSDEAQLLAHFKKLESLPKLKDQLKLEKQICWNKNHPSALKAQQLGFSEFPGRQS